MKTSQTANGSYKLAIVDAKTKAVVWEDDWKHNLILNQGLVSISARTWAASFIAAIAGTDGKANSRSSLGTTAECTLEGTVTLNGPGFAFSAGTDVGNILQWDSGEEHRIITVTNGSQAYVYPNPQAGTITPDLFTFYHANYTQLGAEAKRSNDYLTGDPFCVSSLDTGTGVLRMRRTYDFTAEVAPTTYREFGVGWSVTPMAANTTFSRVVIPGGVDLMVDQQLRLTYELQVTVAPITPQVGSANIVGWPVAPSVTTNGTYMLQRIGMQNVATTGGTGDIISQHRANEPSTVFRTYMWITNNGDPPAAFNAAPPARENLAFTDKWGGTALTRLNTTGIIMSVNKEYTFPVGAINLTNHRSIGLGYAESTAASPPDGAEFVFVFDETQSKANTQTLTLATLHTWSRLLVPDAT